MASTDSEEQTERITQALENIDLQYAKQLAETVDIFREHQERNQTKIAKLSKQLAERGDIIRKLSNQIDEHQQSIKTKDDYIKELTERPVIRKTIVWQGPQSICD